MSIRFRQFGDSDDGAINPELDPEPTLQDLQILQQELNTTDLELSVSDSPDPVAAGTQLTLHADRLQRRTEPGGVGADRRHALSGRLVRVRQPRVLAHGGRRDVQPGRAARSTIRPP